MFIRIYMFIKSNVLLILLFFFQSNITFAYEVKPSYEVKYRYLFSDLTISHCVLKDDCNNYPPNEYNLNKFILSGEKLSNQATRDSLKYLILWSGNTYITYEDYKYIKKWFKLSKEKNPYELKIALRESIFKLDYTFSDENVKKYLIRLYWSLP